MSQRLTPERIAEGLSGRYIEKSLEIQAILDLQDARRDIANLTAQLAAKDADLEQCKIVINDYQSAETACHKRIREMEAELAALKAATTGAVSEAMVEAGIAALPGRRLDADEVFAILTAANLASGTRAKTIRRDAFNEIGSIAEALASQQGIKSELAAALRARLEEGDV